MTSAHDPKNPKDPKPHARRSADLGPESEFGRLVSALCNGTLTRPDRDRLEKLLDDPAVRAAYRKHMRLHAGLVRLWHQGAASGGGDGVDGSTDKAALARGIGAARGRSGHAGGQAAAFSAVAIQWLQRLLVALSRPVPVAMLVAGSVVAGFLGVAAAVKVPPPAVSSGSTALVSAARITGLHEAKWRSPEGSHGLSDFLFAGTTLAIESGLVELRYDCGATVIVEGPAVLHVDGRSTARLDRGRLTAKLEKAGASAAGHRAGEDLPRLFTVHTPRASVHDLGTEFGVEVREAGDADIQVFDGLVELARADRGLTTASDAADLRLAAGDGAQIDESGRITATGGAAVKKFVRTLPKAKPTPQKRPPEWNAAIAEVIYRDDFTGSGALHGTTPGSRQGVGAIAWEAAPTSWGVMETAGGQPRLTVAGGGVASLPFTPEPGCLYKLSVTLDVMAGGSKWAAAGFIDPSAPFTESDPFNYAWFAQRHRNNPSLNPPYDFNMHSAGPGRTPRLRGDPFVGERLRAIVLDTASPRWSVQFLVGERVVGRYVYDVNPTGIRRIGIGAYGVQTRAAFRSFALARVVVPSTINDSAVNEAAVAAAGERKE